MRVFQLNKLVKDSVYESMLELGQQPEVTILDDTRFEIELHRKIVEELEELRTTDNSQHEWLDVLGALRQIALLKEIDTTGILMVPSEELGAFDQRIYIGALVLQDDDPWVEYYASYPDRFPEVT